MLDAILPDARIAEIEARLYDTFETIGQWADLRALTASHRAQASHIKALEAEVAELRKDEVRVPVDPAKRTPEQQALIDEVT